MTHVCFWQVVLGTLVSYFVSLNKKFQVPILGDIPKGYLSHSEIYLLMFLQFQQRGYSLRSWQDLAHMRALP